MLFWPRRFGVFDWNIIAPPNEGFPRDSRASLIHFCHPLLLCPSLKRTLLIQSRCHLLCLSRNQPLVTPTSTFNTGHCLSQNNALVSRKQIIYTREHRAIRNVLVKSRGHHSHMFIVIKSVLSRS
ncbi:hypothetical protein BS47DRAFT_187899 [Hydnum rufescens UP504]|uniref:Uncharacterized protein n=1 Tax=Hydnum rufescens UP504 TaxID=1448309 RepID=A0A9P6AND1_9AGAM|nr:hypothetical protein BS47DRAFT_187899 [Hydnum rufescens UP504]